jgi:hypothetical protein
VFKAKRGQTVRAPRARASGRSGWARRALAAAAAGLVLAALGLALDPGALPALPAFAASLRPPP